MLKKTSIGCVNEITKFMDEYVKPELKKEKDYYVFIESEEKSGEPIYYEKGDDFYVWFLKFPGNNCGSICFSVKKHIIKFISINDKDNKLFTDSKKLEEELTKKFSGKTLDTKLK